MMSTDVDTNASSSSRSSSSDNNNDDTKAYRNPSVNKYQLRPGKSLAVHGVVRRDGPLNESVASIANVSLEEAVDLILLGAVWARMDQLTQEELLAMYDNDDETSGSRVMYADLPKGWNAGVDDSGNVQFQQSETDRDLDDYIQSLEDQRYRRILTPSHVEAGVDLRIYTNPRRFPACYDMSKHVSIIHEDTTFIVVDKPPMLPTQPDASNYQECCPGCVASLLGPFQTILGEPVERPLLCHRVDSVVGGCVVLSKDRNGQKVFHELQRDRKLRKVYLAVTTKQVPLGMHVHWMWGRQSARGVTGGPPCQLIRHSVPESRRKAREHWNRCVLEVVKCERIEIDDDDRTNQAEKATNLLKVHYQSTIRLVTGRKHQVRAQLASLGCPIIRDTLYEPMSGMTLDNLEQGSGDDDNDEGDMDERISRCRVPTEPIGLQAAGILFGGIKARANPPWWGTRVIRDN